MLCLARMVGYDLYTRGHCVCPLHGTPTGLPYRCYDRGRPGRGWRSQPAPRTASAYSVCAVCSRGQMLASAPCSRTLWHRQRQGSTFELHRSMLSRANSRRSATPRNFCTPHCKQPQSHALWRPVLSTMCMNEHTLQVADMCDQQHGGNDMHRTNRSGDPCESHSVRSTQAARCCKSNCSPGRFCHRDGTFRHTSSNGGHCV